MSTERQPRIRPRRFDYPAGHSTGRHVHDEHQLVYASDGVLSVETEGSRWVLPGQRAAWIPAGVFHTVIAASDATMAALYVEAIGEPVRDGLVVFDVSPLLRQLIVHLVDQVGGEPDDGPARTRLERVALDQLATAPEMPVRLARLRDPRLRSIEAAFEADPRDGRTLAQFGAAVGAGERTLQRLFAAETGTTFGRWRTLLRLQHGLVELGRGASVTTAATRAGYDQPSAFIAAFKATFGTTPGRYVDR
ncbi:MAG: helix-turn-helix transcriptional regulator [Actinomycetota bacterium]